MSSHPSPPTPARIFLVDDHPIVREGVALYLANHPEFKVCGQAGSAREALAVVQTLAVDCVILDLALADEDGLGLLTDLRRILPAVPVLILSMHGDPDLVRRALTLGASGFVRKEDAAGHLVTALRRVLQGEVYLPGDLSRQGCKNPRWSPGEPSPPASSSG
jgi:DNA-binding NarL/FixJ family response regulator